MCLGAHDVLGPAGWATTNARHVGERGGRQLARMFAHTNGSFLVGFFPSWVRKHSREPRAEATLACQHIDTRSLVRVDAVEKGLVIVGSLGNL